MKNTKMQTLPLFITEKNKFYVLIFSYLVFLLSYLFLNHFHFFTPKELPFTFVDQMMPFIPETVWIYFSDYIFFVFAYLAINNMANMNRYFYALFGAQFASLLIFFFWPTIFPRENFPLPNDLDFLTYLAFSTGRTIDSPASCFPSLHVGLVFLSSLVFLHESRRKFLFFFTWSALIAISTMTTKQHYFADVIGGITMATIMYTFFFRVMSYQENSPNSKHSRQEA